jgi:hypothetical protein
MNEIIFPIRMPYRQAFVRQGRRRPESDWFLDEGSISVQSIGLDRAPVAYRVDTGAGDAAIALDRPYEIRSFGGHLWWPLMSIEGPVTVARFLEFAERGYPGALLAIDPAIPSHGRSWPRTSFEKSGHSERPESNKNERWASLRRNALRVVFCGDAVLLEAGEPVAYAFPLPGTGYRIEIGHSARERREQRFHLPGPNREKRLQAAGAGLAFDVGEWPVEIGRMMERGATIEANFRVERSDDHVPVDTAALLCAQALIDVVLVKSVRDDHEGTVARFLPNFFPLVAEAEEMADTSLYCRAIEQLADCSDFEMICAFESEIRTAREILRRLWAAGNVSLAPEDEDAIASLAL